MTRAGSTDARGVGTPQGLAAVEKARKLLNLAYDKSATTPERELALTRATEVLKRVGLSVEDLKSESTPDYLVQAKRASQGYNARQGVELASKLKRSGWVADDPRNHAYKDRRNYDESS